MNIQVHEVAAFSDQPYGGSPTGVVLQADGLNSTQMQRIAHTLNYSHTAFLTELGLDVVNIRFFTPQQELQNCGHATIAAHVARAYQMATSTWVKQKTIAGVQEVEIRREDGAVQVYFKQNEVQFTDIEPDVISGLRSFLKIPPAALDDRYPIILASPGANRFLVTLNSQVVLEQMRPAFSALKHFCELHESIGCFVVALTSPTEATARMFAPSIGIDEDIINGNSSGCLGAYLLKLYNIQELTLPVHQGHAFNRPGTVIVKAKQVAGKIETWIGGTATIATSLLLEVPPQ